MVKVLPVKRPRGRKDGVVAKREAKPERLALKEIRKKKPKKRTAVPLYGCRRPLRIRRNGSRKRKRDADKVARRKTSKTTKTGRRFYWEPDNSTDSEIDDRLGGDDETNFIITG
jgi:hypothetical protein